MNDNTLDRRDLCRLALAALGGLTAGALVGCGGGKTETASAPGKAEKDHKDTAADATPPLLQDPHVCRGINTCKNKGKKGTTNDCAGQAHCATVAAHDCNGMNDCKGQGGCGEHPGENECKGKGGCEVPLERQDLAQGTQAIRGADDQGRKKVRRSASEERLSCRRLSGNGACLHSHVPVPVSRINHVRGSASI